MAKKASLADALQQSAGRTASTKDTTKGAPTHTIPRPPSRQGKKTIAGHFDPTVSRQLREIALAEDSSVQELLREALNDLFTKRGKPPLA